MTNIAERTWRRGGDEPDRLALACGESRWSYGLLRERMAAIGGAALATGALPGDRVLLVAPSVPEFTAAFYGLHAAGLAVVAANPMATVPELSYLIEDAGCRLAIAWHEAGEAAARAAAESGAEFWSLTEGGSVGAVGTPLAEPARTGDEDTAVILYTSGTTGRPKGAELTHANLVACAEIFAAALEVGPEDRFGTALPLFHIFGGAVIMGPVLRAGASLTLLPRFDALAALEMIRSERLTAFAGVPTMYSALLPVIDDPSDLGSLRLCASGGASLPEEIMRMFEERFDLVILEGYGLTETAGAATFSGLHRRRKAGAVGLPLPGIELRVVDDQDREVPAGEVGEVAIRTPTLMKRYHGRPKATAEAVRDGWLYTGDLGSRDEEGDLRIVDRRKDMIIRGGYNVYPREVEEVLYQHPDIIEVAVIGVDDDRLGEEVAAAVALRVDAAIEPAELRGWAKERLSAYKVPHLWQFLDELPKGPTGKILKRAIDRKALGGP